MNLLFKGSGTHWTPDLEAGTPEPSPDLSQCAPAGQQVNTTSLRHTEPPRVYLSPGAGTSVQER